MDVWGCQEPLTRADVAMLYFAAGAFVLCWLVLIALFIFQCLALLGAFI